ncbi:Metallo-beta-lactamase family protein, RNA-specific [hydrothermal vent metagenome]|uniref:Metallo-beta-lactamase family protein, RNA-specific n=1 Tax=hydrothermal vent metagenome TaxID=652676 RepID=A0A3B1E708_9ZZZZ
MKFTFLGAAGEVTGSQHLIETDTLRVLLDCGFFQGRRKESYLKNSQFRCDPENLDVVILSHAHLDHCGNLPGLYKAGYRGPIFCTSATAEIVSIMLRDSAKIQSEDAKYLSKHDFRDGPPLVPLYDDKDVREVTRLFETVKYNQWEEFSPALSFRFADAGHILGSAITEIQIEDKSERKRIVFTGDLGRRGLPLLKDPTPVGGCDVLITESTYGNRIHRPPADIKSDLLRIITDATNDGGRVIIPAFSLGRTQQLIYFLNELTEEDLLPKIPVYVDSPLATRLTDVFREHQDLLDDDSQKTLLLDDDLFEFPQLRYVQSRQESMDINRSKGPFVVISASGMCENGRIRHHLKHAVTDSRNRIVIIGYQAADTLGRRIVEKQPKLKIFNKYLPLNAKVEVLNGLSAHADAEDFKWWFEHLAKETGVGQAFLVHGERDSAKSLATILADYCDEDPIIPQLYQSFEV